MEREKVGYWIGAVRASVVGVRDMNYRPDIDGLRAFAVLPVVLCHAGIPAFAGGFIGVDVFFVISGYLITRLILADMQAGTFSIGRFYERRARRLLPALIVVILFCWPVARYLMWPDYFQNFAQSVVATLFFANNVLLSITTGYWDLDSQFKPLLHTWSLGVEEQFYILYPLILAVVWRAGRRFLLPAIIALGLASLIYAEIGWRSAPAASYYLLWGRAWELMAGCGAALLVMRQRRIDGFLAALGLIMVLLAVFFFDETTPAPSLYFLLPVVGTVFVLQFCRPGTLAYSLLSVRPLVGVGLISYSLYLWHQPLFAFTRIALPTPPGIAVMLLISLLAVVLGWFSWRFIETPFRSSGRVSLRGLVAAGVVSCVSLIGVGLYVHVKKGFPENVFPNIEAGGDVYIGYNERIRALGAVGEGEGSRAILIVGDSSARDFANILLESGLVGPEEIAYFPYTDLLRLTPADHRHVVELAAGASVIFYSAKVVVLEDVENYLRLFEGAGDASWYIVGPKNFGYNLNPFGRVPLDQRAAARVDVIPEVIDSNMSLSARYAPNYVDLLAGLGAQDGRAPVFDADGNPLSPDRIHLTRYGARYLAGSLPLSQYLPQE